MSLSPPMLPRRSSLRCICSAAEQSSTTGAGQSWLKSAAAPPPPSPLLASPAADPPGGVSLSALAGQDDPDLPPKPPRSIAAVPPISWLGAAVVVRGLAGDGQLPGLLPPDAVGDSAGGDDICWPSSDQRRAAEDCLMTSAACSAATAAAAVPGAVSTSRPSQANSKLLRCLGASTSSSIHGPEHVTSRSCRSRNKVMQMQHEMVSHGTADVCAADQPLGAGREGRKPSGTACRGPQGPQPAAACTSETRCFSCWTR